ncbi:SDR family oxidoreductase [Streptomyces sp. W16]|uniref:SDR family NAD(P)-dependent oxidoreductase n=1 Tax=Streptomyces sp. W16 TaxID=3076631 RepID=UPI00295AFD63|nr:SDR family NAD(P)-dependent oxidoreductase [Streptomyces sp. W16]MDV9169066.1 SDR family oxidoreductase [Streptomyces sp. W16]
MTHRSAHRLTDRVALVTGGGSGIGRATAPAFAREGATVAVAGPEPEDLEQTVKLIRQAGGPASPVTADLTRGPDVIRVVRTTVERHGGLHVAFNNSGVTGPVRPVADLCEVTWSDVLATNLTGVWLCVKHEVRHMREHGGGVIVNTACNVGVHGRLPAFGAYAASNAALSALTRTAAREYISEGIRINAVSPGRTGTEKSGRAEATASRAGRGATPEEIANTVLRLASDESESAVGHDLVPAGGVSNMPPAAALDPRRGTSPTTDGSAGRRV